MPLELRLLSLMPAAPSYLKCNTHFCSRPSQVKWNACSRSRACNARSCETLTLVKPLLSWSACSHLRLWRFWPSHVKWDACSCSWSFPNINWYLLLFTVFSKYKALICGLSLVKSHTCYCSRATHVCSAHGSSFLELRESKYEHNI